MARKKTTKKQDIDFSTYEKDPNAGEVEIQAMQVMYTPMGTTVKPAQFRVSDRVITTQKVDMDNVEIPEGITLVVMEIMGDDVYGLIGPEGLVVKLNAAYLEKVKED